MAHYRITNTISGLCLGTYEGATEADALEAMAREAGYENYAATQAVAPEKDGELRVEEIERTRTS